MAKSSKALPALNIREARISDLPRIVEMLADDVLGAQREWYSDPLRDAYYDAFASIDADRNNLLIVAETEGRVVGTLQITFIPYLSYQGSWRALIEGVRVDSNLRGEGLGEALVSWAIEMARQRRCLLVQLTTDKRRDDAQRFYEKLGFVASHEGMKLLLK